MSCTTIQHLPVEILSLILDSYQWNPPALPNSLQVPEHTATSLLQVAIVHPSWTEVALDLIYRDITINNMHQAEKLSNPRLRHRFRKTSSLRVISGVWGRELDTIVRAAVGLTKLFLMYPVGDVPLNLLQYPSLRNLKVLNLFCTFDPSSNLGPWIPTTPIHLQSLTVQPSSENLPLIDNLLSTCLSYPEPFLKTLKVYSGLQHISSLLPIAPVLTSLHTGYTGSKLLPILHILDFLSHCTSLTSLELQITTSSQLSQLLLALTCPPLHSLNLVLNLSYERLLPGIFEVICEGIGKDKEGWGGKLKEIGFVFGAGRVEERLERCEKWSKMGKLLEEMGTKMRTTFVDDH